MASSPVVASPVGEIKHIVTHDSTGFLVEGADAWEGSLLRLINDRGLRERMGGRGRRVVEEGYSINACAKQFLEMLETLTVK